MPFGKVDAIADAGLPDVEQLALLFDKHSLTRLEYEHDDYRVVLERTVPASSALCASQSEMQPTLCASQNEPQALSSAQQPVPQSTTTDSRAENITVVRAPIVGITYSSREPGAPAFVSAGIHVNIGDVLCLVEAMKMFNEIKAPVAGTVQEIHFENGAFVEHGAALVSILPEASNAPSHTTDSSAMRG